MVKTQTPQNYKRNLTPQYQQTRNYNSKQKPNLVTIGQQPDEVCTNFDGRRLSKLNSVQAQTHQKQKSKENRKKVKELQEKNEGNTDVC